MEAGTVTGDGKKRTPIEDPSDVPGAIPPTITEDDDPDVEKLRQAMAAAEGDGSVTASQIAAGTVSANAVDDGPPPISEEGPQDIPVAEPIDHREQDDDDHPAPEPVNEDDPEEILEPRTLPVPRTLSDSHEPPWERTYTQKPLSWFGKIELYGTFGRAIDAAMAGDNGLSVDDLMSSMQPKDLLELFKSDLPGADTSPDAEQEEDEAQKIGMQAAGRVLATFARILSLSPELLKEVYCIILAVPKGHRKWVVDWALDEMNDETGEDILHVFIDQNWPVMEDFYRRRLPKMLTRAKQARRRFQQDQSKP